MTVIRNLKRKTYFPFERPIWVKNDFYQINSESCYNIIRQLLKIPRSMKYYHTIKELLRALTLSMLLSLEIANA